VDEQKSLTSVVVVVEDEPVIRLLVTDTLEEAGFAVLEASDGDHAMRLLEDNANRVCALFSDINLPGSMNGVLLAKRARQHWPWISVVLASGRARPDDANMPARTRFFAKPYSLAAIVKHIREVVDQPGA
jgi:CheY-like chemotaxis protein